MSPFLRTDRVMRYAGVALFVVLTALLYWPTMKWLANIWRYDKEYSHGILVPAVALYLVWRKREYLATMPAKPETISGCAVIGASALLFLAGRSGGFILAEAMSLLLLFPGIILLVWGWQRLRVLAMPLIYLQFMVPWIEEFVDRIHVPFQLFSAWLGCLLITATGIPVYLDGRYISLPNIVLEVAKECSGVRYLTTVIALGLPLTYLTQTKWKRAIAVLASGVLITIVVNGFRIALAGNMAYRYSPELLHGPLHIFQGWFVAQVGFVALVLVNWRVARRSEPGAPVLCDAWRTSFGVGVPSDPGFSDGRARKLAVLVYIGGILALSHWHIDPVAIPREAGGRPLPRAFAGWEGKDRAWIRGNEFFPGVDHQVARVYSDGDGRELYFYSGYFGVQRQGKSIMNFRAHLLTESAVSMDTGLPRGPKRIESSELVIDGVRYRIYYWYWLRSRYLSGRYPMKAWTIVDALLHHRNDATVYMVAQPVKTHDAPADWPAVKGFVEGAAGALEAAPVKQR